MTKGIVIAASCAVVAIAGVVFAQQQDFSKVEIKATKITDKVYMLEGSGGNIGVSVGDDGIVIVDDQFAPLAPKIKDALKKISEKPIKFVINTHFHGDHTGGNSEFGGQSYIMAHENVHTRLKGGANGKQPSEALPVITFKESSTLHLNGEEIRAIHFPNGHTDGDSVIFFTQANVVHTGDDFVTYGFPFVDAASGGTVGGMIAGLEKVLSMTKPDTKFIPGHGPLCTPADVRKFIDMMKDTREMVSKAAKEGKTADQMKKDNLLAKYADLGKGFIKADGWIDLLYKEVTKK